VELWCSPRPDGDVGVVMMKITCHASIKFTHIGILALSQNVSGKDLELEKPAFTAHK